MGEADNLQVLHFPRMSLHPKRWSVFLVALLASGIAMAHPHLRAAQPSPGGRARAVREVRLRFSEDLEPVLSTVHVESGSGEAVVEPHATVARGDPRTLVLRLRRKLPAGRYRVRWAAVGADGHRTHGSYWFTASP